MSILAFDTAQGALSAALLDDSGEALAHHFELRTRGHAEALLPLLERLLAEAGLQPSDIDALAVTIGPGTFTGLRSGLAAARGFALARGLPLVGVTTLEAVAHSVTLNESETLGVAFDARRGEIYFQLFDSELRPENEPQLLALDDAARLLPATPLALAGTGAALLAEASQRADARLIEQSQQPDALDVAKIAYREIGSRGLDAFRIAPSPLYLRAPDAKLPGGLDPVVRR